MALAEQWDCSHDVVIVGSGAGGLTAALVARDLGLDALVIEKSELIGGTTAVSGGAVWIPNNPQMLAAGVTDSTEEALRYLRETIGDDYDDEKLRAYVETGPALIRYLEKHTDVAFAAGPLPDYYSNRPGGKIKYRALDPLPLSARELGDDIRILRPPHPQTKVAGVTFTTGEVGKILRKEPGWLTLAFKLAFRHFSDFSWRRRFNSAPRLTIGNALVARCLISLRKRGVPIWRETAFEDLVTGAGRIVGVVARREGRQVRIGAGLGVIFAAGGFGSNPEMRKAWLARCPDVERSVAPDINTGEAIAAGIRAGADTGLMDEAWWIPVYRLDESGLTCGMFFDRAFPGSIIVNQRGERFMNEAANYDEAGREMIKARVAGEPDVPSYFIFDAHYRRNYLAGPLQPSPGVFDAFLPKEVREKFIKAPTLAALATELGVDGAVLERTVARFNELARSGKDSDFGRGEEAYERHYSDPRVSPNSTMAPITQAPFYAVPIHAGDIGTKGGLLTDRDARVLGVNGEPIPGLYAVGSSSASVMGRTYPAGGVTIGPAMVFGARAVMQIAGKSLPD